MWPYNILNTDQLNNRDDMLWPAPKVGYNTLLDLKFVEGSSSSITEPFSVQEFKDWGKIDVSDDDVLIEELITSAREICEGFLCISLIPRTVIAILDNSNGNSYLPYGPVVELISITDVDGNAITTDNYKLQLEDFKRLSYPYSKYVRLEYTAGYDTVPRKIKTGILQQLLYMYQHRGDEVYISRTGSIDVGLAPEAESTLSPYSRNA